MNGRRLTVLMSPWLLACTGSIVLAAGLDDAEDLANPQAAEAALEGGAATITGDELVRRLEATAAAAERSLKAVNTAHLKFRVFRRGGGFKHGCTEARLESLLAKHDLVARPDSIREIATAIMGEPLPMGWGEMELFVLNDPERGAHVRETRRDADGSTHDHVQGPEWSLRWDSRNAQMDIMPTREDRFAITQLHDFHTRLHIDGKLPPVAVASLRDATGSLLKANGRQVLEMRRPEKDGATSVTALDVASGFFVRDEGKGRGYRVIRRWLGWEETAAGVRHPRAVVELRFDNDQLTYAAFRVMDEAKFNAPLPETVFQLGAPAGAVIVSHEGEETRARRINRDLFDVLSKQSLAEAMKPNEAPLTPEERDAIALLEKIYALPEDDVLKRIAPPFPLARKHLPRMLHPGYAEPPRGDRFYFLSWRDGRLTQEHGYQGRPPSLAGLIHQLLKHPLTDVDVPKEVLDRPMPGDYVIRPDAGEKAILPALANVMSQELGRPVLLLFQNVERNVFVARGEIKLAETKLRWRGDRPLIAMNGGEHDGDFGEVIGFGDLDDLLRELSDYLHVKVVDETAEPGGHLAWSRRWYDLASTPADKRFVLKPEKALKLISAQTGIEFVKRKESVRVLRMLGK
jgi:hypothetical protein